MQWQIQDETGVIHSGTEEEMREAFDCMTGEDHFLKENYSPSQINQWKTDWEGDLLLVQIHDIYR